MQGSFRDTVEKFAHKKKNTEVSKHNKADRQWRDRRRNRHSDEQ